MPICYHHTIDAIPYALLCFIHRRYFIDIEKNKMGKNADEKNAKHEASDDDDDDDDDDESPGLHQYFLKYPF